MSDAPKPQLSDAEVESLIKNMGPGAIMVIPKPTMYERLTYACIRAADKVIDGFLLAAGALSAYALFPGKANATELVTVTAASQESGLGGYGFLLLVVGVTAALVFLKIKKPAQYDALAAGADRAWQWAKAAFASIRKPK